MVVLRGSLTPAPRRPQVKMCLVINKVDRLVLEVFPAPPRPALQCCAAYIGVQRSALRGYSDLH